MGALLAIASKYILPNKLVVGLGLALALSGYLLIASYKANGKQAQLLKQFEQSNQALEQAYNNRLLDIKRLQEKMVARQKKQSEINFDLSVLRKQLAGFNDEKECIDFDLGNEFSKLLDTPAISSD